MSPAAVPRLVSSIISSMSPVPRPVRSQQQALHVAGGAAADFLQGGAQSQLPAAAAGNRAQISGCSRPGAAVAATAAAGAGAPLPRQPSLVRAAASRIDAGRPGTGRENLAQNRPERSTIGSRVAAEPHPSGATKSATNTQQNNPGNFWQENPGWAAYAVTRPFAWATWGSVGSWCGYAGEPTAYGYGENVYYSGDQVYYGDQPIATAEEYAEQAAAIASSAPP